MDKIYNKFAEALEDVIDKTPGATWEDKAACLIDAMRERDAGDDLEELASWLLKLSE